MPHQCTDCGRTFDDGSKQMLSGCPDCGGNKFQYDPGGVDDEPASEEPPEPPEPAVNNSVARTVGNAATAVRDLVGSESSPETPDFDSAPTAESEPRSSTADRTQEVTPDRTRETTSTVDSKRDTRSRVEGTASTERTTSATETSMAERENSAQASARSDVVSPDDLPPAPDQPTRSRPAPVMDDTSESDPADEQSVRDDRPDLEELREELNEQFESIRVLEPGQYELNLMELFDREEYIIALQEDGKYTIQVPERWEE